MINDVINKIGYKFHRIGFYFLAVKHDVKNKKANFFMVLIDNLKIFNYKYGYYEYLEIPITTKCSLRCKYCSNLISCYEKPKDYDLDVLKKSINAFLKCINKVMYVRVLGGEPFLSNNLQDVLKKLLKSDKIGCIEVVTNGTIIPTDKKLLKLLKNDKITVCISEYPFVKHEKLIKQLKKYNINYRIKKLNYWMNYGNTEKKNKTEKQLIKQFSRCDNVCKSLVNGQLHICPRSSHGTDLGIIKNNENDYVNLLDDSTSVEEKRKQINKLFKSKSIKACDYCDYGTKKSKKIAVAEQLKNSSN